MNKTKQLVTITNKGDIEKINQKEYHEIYSDFDYFKNLVFKNFKNVRFTKKNIISHEVNEINISSLLGILKPLKTNKGYKIRAQVQKPNVDNYYNDTILIYRYKDDNLFFWTDKFMNFEKVKVLGSSISTLDIKDFVEGFKEEKVICKKNKNKQTYKIFITKNPKNLYDHSHISLNNKQIEDEIEEKIKQDHTIPETTKLALRESRIGQGIFRKNVLEEMNKCLISNIDCKKVLEVAHIKPWRYSKNKERLDAKNGIVLTPTYHKLFDLGLISFTQEGKLLKSPQLSKQLMKYINNNNNNIKTCFEFFNTRKEYIQYHNENIFKKTN